MNDKDKIIINLYKKGLSLKKIADIVEYKSVNSVKNILVKNNIQIRSRAGYKEPFNEDFFNNINSEEKAYWLGFFTADGNVYPRKDSQPCVRIELAQRDKYILEKLRKSLNLKLEIKDTRKNCCILRVHSQKMFDDLNKYGIIPAKTGKEKFIVLDNKELMRHYIRGFFDGDGWVTNTTSHGKRKGSRKNIGFCGNHAFLNDLKKYLTNELNVYDVKITDRKGCSMFLYCSSKDVNSITHYFYDNSNIYLFRKYDECFSTYVNTEKGI